MQKLVLTLKPVLKPDFTIHNYYVKTTNSRLNLNNERRSNNKNYKRKGGFWTENSENVFIEMWEENKTNKKSCRTVYPINFKTRFMKTYSVITKTAV